MTVATEGDISPRETEVLQLLGAHFSNAEIAARLFISVRTVESHVSSLLRKLGVPDRRALAQRAAVDQPHREPAPLPAPLTSFIGRVRERAELSDLIMKHRQVTAAGPGGVGKTRLALAVAAEVADQYADGVWFADLIPVTDPGMIATAVAGALGLGEQPGRDLTESVVAALADRQALLVFDNCEHVVDGVAPFLERLLAACPRVTVLATSQARLMVPFERVYQVPPLSLAGESDAVALFLERAAAAGRPLDPPRHDEIAAICARLDGMALAIELAAARYPTLGLDGVTAALSHPLRMLTGGYRADDRHRSVRAVLDWSHALLEPADQELLHQVSIFVAPFTASAATDVTESAIGVVADGLARLAEQSLLAVAASPQGTCYRALETIRQYGTERLSQAGELAGARVRHLRWCLAQAVDLAVAGPDWRARFDAVADDLRAALTWAASEPERRADAYRLARHLAELTFTRHLIGESQHRYEQAATLADDPAVIASMLRQAAAVAGCRMRGDDMYRLYRAAGAAARQAAGTARAAADLATAALATYRFDNQFDQFPEPEEVIGLITEARELAGDDPSALAMVALAEAGRLLTEAFSASGNPARETVTRVESAVELARQAGDPLGESAALDTLIVTQSWAGDMFASAATARRRITLLSAVPDGPAKTHELIDALAASMESSLGAGDLPNARRYARQLADHPLLAEVGHRATACLLVADALAGNAGDVLAASTRFLDAWRRAGSPARAGLGPPAAAVAMIHGLRDDHAAHGEWSAILHQLDTSPWQTHGYGAVFDALLMLHRGQAEEAMERMAPEPGEARIPWIWFHWYVALRSEAAVFAGTPDARDRVAEARTIVAGNPIACAIVERAESFLDQDQKRLLRTADAFEAAGCHYQAARTMILAGGEHAARGAAVLADLGLAP
jgi:predicted ATPase/DNA-binding CsgD family transcriptional regulator